MPEGESTAGRTELAGTVEGGVHRTRARIYYADTDFSGLVYHARYLEFLERGRSDLLRHAGIIHSELIAGHGEAPSIAWVVRRMEIDFRGAARIDDIVTVETRLSGLSGARATMDQAILRDEDLLVGARVEAATIDGKGRPVRFPKPWRSVFADLGLLGAGG